MRFVQYVVPSGDSATIQIPLGIEFGNQLLLEGYTLLNKEVTAGGILELSCFGSFWARQMDATNYSPIYSIRQVP